MAGLVTGPAVCEKVKMAAVIGHANSAMNVPALFHQSQVGSNLLNVKPRNFQN
jgi:hypothetical protein